VIGRVRSDAEDDSSLDALDSAGERECVRGEGDVRVVLVVVAETVERGMADKRVVLSAGLKIMGSVKKIRRRSEKRTMTKLSTRSRSRS